MDTRSFGARSQADLGLVLPIARSLRRVKPRDSLPGWRQSGQQMTVFTRRAQDPVGVVAKSSKSAFS